MKLKVLVFALLLMLTIAVSAQEHSLTFDGLGFTFDQSLATGVNITQFDGDPTDLEQPGGPEVAHTQFVLYNQLPVPESIYDAPGAIRLYHTADFEGYEFPQQELQNLQTLLEQRPDLSEQEVLPFMPTMPAAQVIRARPEYVENDFFSGIRYITAYRQDVSPFLGNDFFYTFQGLSKDGSAYVTVVFRLSTELFPAELPADFNYDTFSAGYEQYLTESLRTLNEAAPEAFVPSLAAVENLTRSLTFTGEGVVESPEVEAPVALTGTWTLVSYGSPENPTPVVSGGTPVTLTFSQNEAGGNAGCNSYGGTVSVTADTIRFSEIVSTMMACAEEAVMNQEIAYLQALNSATSYTVTDDQLQIFYDGGVLVFALTPSA